MFTDFAILLGMVYVYLPLMVLPLYASMEKLDFRLVEAGYDLYANRLQVLRRVIIPLVKPGIVAGSILVFIPSLGAYVTPRVLGGGKNMMLGNLIELQFGQGRNWPLGAALSITLMVIVMVALLVYVRNASRSGAPAWLSAGTSTSAASPASRRSRCFTFVLLYLPIVDARRLLLQRRQLDRHLGAASRCAGTRPPGSNASVQDAALRSLVIAVVRRVGRHHRRDHGGAGHHPHRALSRPDLQIRLHQPAADGAGDRHRGGAADLLRARSRCATGYSGLGYLIAAHTAFCIPFAYLPIRARLESMDLTLERAAADLYATPWKAFRRVTLPLLWPGIIAGFMLAFVISLDDVVITEFVKSGGQDTLPTYMLGQLRRVVTPEINAISTAFLALSVVHRDSVLLPQPAEESETRQRQPTETEP